MKKNYSDEGSSGGERYLPPIQAKRPALPALSENEQYRFHFDLGKCIGCKCCEVACHEQNNNPATVKWRKVGEVEGGDYPNTTRLYISMACNQCLEPSCLTGCPVDAYYKDPRTGAVLMREEACIGCGYCTWNCPYEAPQFNAERGMVTKCNLCHDRLLDGDRPACVEACPSGALEIETVNRENWRENLSLANAPGVPDAGLTVSTTRLTVPSNLKDNLQRADTYRLKPNKPHTSLILMTVLTQLSVGGFLSLLLADFLIHRSLSTDFLKTFLKIGPAAMLGTALLALLTSIFHLGRPLFAFRALKMWRRSWLSREVLSFSLFALFSALYSLVRWQGEFSGTFPVLAGLVGVAGIAGIFSSARIYMVPARPSWNNCRTPIAFFATALVLGPLATLTLFAAYAGPFSTLIRTNGTGIVGQLLVAIVLAAGLVQLASILIKLLYLLSHEEPELAGSAHLLTQWFKIPFLLRLLSLFCLLLGLPLTLTAWSDPSPAFDLSSAPWVATLFVLATLSELLGRYLFFVTVVPKNRPEGFFA